MVDTSTCNLCVQIIDSHFGHLISKVASTLLIYGRLSLLQIARYSTLKPRAVRAAVIVLIQHNLAWHANSEDEGEVIEFNTEECLLRLRYGRFVWQAEQLYGQAASEMVSLILDHGKLQAKVIIEELCPGNAREDTSVYSQALHKLVSNAYLAPSTILSHYSPHDKLFQYEMEEKSKIKNFPTAKELIHAKEIAETRLKQELEEAMKTGLTKRKNIQNGRLTSGKRKVDDKEVVNDEVYFRINGTKFNTHIRDKIVEEAACERYNESAAIVMRAILKACEAKGSISDVRSANISVMNVLDHIADEGKLHAGLAHSKKRTSASNVVREYLGILASADNPTLPGRAATFISFGGATSGKICVEFEIICRRLRRRVLEAVIRERYGDEAVRIVRLLLENGKMGGDQIAKVAMMPVTAVRPLLTLLSADSLVSIQEVPKGADRNPQRTIYLWYVDLRKAYSVLLGNFYKTLYNIGARRLAEEEDETVKAVLAKSERSDVREDQSLLSRVEREVLKTWEERRDKLTVLEMRVEEAVFILRDLNVLCIDEY